MCSYGQTQYGSVKQLFAPGNRNLVIVAHRGCHEAAPKHGFTRTPENSLAALEHCVAMGVDMMEIDVHMTADGHLVIMHDATVDRTTDGHGTIAQMTLADIRKLHLRQNLGGYSEPPTDQHVLTLEEMLRAAKGRITLNLDVKEAIYAEVVDLVLREGAADTVTVKTRAGIASPPLAAIQPFAQVPFVPVLDAHGSNVAAVAEQQASQKKPVAFELPRMASSDLSAVVAVAQKNGIRLFCNTLGDGFIIGSGGDNDALRDPDAVWGWQYRHGISIFQTDRPEELLAFRSGIHN
ncbi:MAG TPA: glycerophosphodiester phosphodiesterase family protein [Terriglobus sp.]